MTIDLGKITQGERGELSFTWQFPSYLSTPATILAATITATMRNVDTGAVSAATGTLTGTTATVATWALSAADSGTAGSFAVTFRAVVSGVATYTLEATLVVGDNPAVDTVAAGALVGVATDDAAYLSTLIATVPTATDVASAADVTAHTAATTSVHGISDTAALVDLTSAQTLTNKNLTDFSNDIDADNVHIEVRNESGLTLAVGTPVYASGYNVGLDIILVSKADATSAATMPVIAIVSAEIANNATGTGVVIGRIENANTSAFAVGDTLYVSETAGALTATKPTGTALIQSVATVLRGHATAGVLEVGSSFSEDLPNLPANQMWYGDGSGVPVAGDAATVRGVIGAEVAGAAAAVQAAAIAALGGADDTASDEQLRNWAGQLPGLMTNVTRTDYSDGIQNGFIAITGIVTWPDGATGHLDGIEHPQAPGILQYFTASHVASGKIVVQSDLSDGVAGIGVITPDYYVDSAAAGGGDGTLATPYNTLSVIPVLIAGDIIAIKSGSVFLESFDFSDGVNVAIYRYGSGAKPIIDSRDAIPAASWILYGGGAGSTYSAPIAWQGSAIGVTVEMVSAWADDVRAKLGSGAAALNAGEYYIATPAAGSGTIYFRASDDGDLSAGAHIIKFTARWGGLATTQAGTGANLGNMIFDGIATIGNGCPGGSILVAENSIIRHCEPSEGNKHNIYYSQGSQLYGVVAKNAYFSSSLTYFVYNQNTPTSVGIYHDSCAAILESGYAGVALGAAGTGFHGHSNAGGIFGTITYNQCYATRISSFLTSATATSIVLNNPYALNVKIPFSAWNNPWYLNGGYILQNDATLTNANAMNFLATVVAVVDGLKLRYEAGTIQNGAVVVAVNGVTFVLRNIDHYVANLSGGGALCACTGVTGLTALITNSKLDVQAGRHYDFGLGGSPTITLLKSNNNHFVDATIDFRVGASSYADFAAWQADGYDLGSIAGGV